MDPRIGQVIASHPVEPCEEVQLDACLIRVDEHVTLRQVVRETIVSGRARDLSAAEDLVTVFKRGINPPGLTEGLLDPTPESLKVELPQPGGPPIVRDYMRGWLVYGHDAPFALPGDSGSIVVDADDCVVAMVVAANRPTPRGARRGPRIRDPDPGHPRRPRREPHGPRPALHARLNTPCDAQARQTQAAMGSNGQQQRSQPHSTSPHPPRQP